jgi:hypothetical protein
MRDGQGILRRVSAHNGFLMRLIVRVTVVIRDCRNGRVTYVKCSGT